MITYKSKSYHYKSLNINSHHDNPEVAAALARPDNQKVTPEPVQRVGPDLGSLVRSMARNEGF